MLFKLFLFLILFLPLNFVSGNEKIDINAAPIKDLIRIKHIGEKRAQEIIATRPFSSLDDLIRIKGIGPKILADIKEQGIAAVFDNPINEKIIPPTNIQNQTTQPNNIPARNETYPSGIFINEVMAWPKGQDAQEEWIELFNQNDFGVDISFWQLKDTAGSVKTYTFPADSQIKAKGFLLLPRPTTKITLNNDADGIELFNPAGNVTDFIQYSGSKNAQTYNRTDQGEWFWSANITPGSENNLASFQEQKESKENQQRLLAQISKPTADNLQKQTMVPVISSAIIMAIFSAAMILFIKKAK